MMNVRFRNFILTNSLISNGDRTLLAVSGGVDSVVMAHLFSSLKLKFGIAHINFQLRKEDSNDDEEFVKKLADELKVNFFSTRFNTSEFAADNKLSTQMAARELRYKWLEQTRKENNFKYIATAHHLNDSVETVLMNIFKGTGIHGLHGIKPINEKLIRPMLCFYKKEIETYAIENKITFRQDASNFKSDYDRNKIRLELIPQIEKHFPSFEKSFAGNISKWTDAEIIYNESLLRLKKRLLIRKNEDSFINIGSLKHLPAYRTILFEILKDYSFTTDQVSQIADTIDSGSGKIFFSPTNRVTKDRMQFIVSPIKATTFSEYLINEEDGEISFDKLKLNFEIKDVATFSIPSKKEFSCLDQSLLEFPLILRKWKQGDYFYPFGMKRKKKKVSDYLIDRKISIPEKENIWIMESGKKICCIIGERIDERFRITSSTKKCFVLELKKNNSSSFL